MLGKQVVRENGPRSIDLDLLLYNDLVMKSDDLEIPHPGIVERDFVLRPLYELKPDFRHPVLDRTLRELEEEGNRPTHVVDFEENWTV